jgi:HAD superfamily hydrolase (TIGR01484 family)
MTGPSGRTMKKSVQSRAAQRTPRPLSDFPPDRMARLGGVLFDIDETLTTDGRLTAVAYGALERLHDAGLLTVPITGRPAGWCDHIARMWPVDAVVGENGAFYFRYDSKARRLLKRFLAGEEERAENRRRLTVLRDRILSAVPGAALASDQPYREADLAIDVCEDVTPLAPAGVERILAMFEAAGARAKVSSVHVNGWFGDYDKLGMTRLLFAECFGIDLDAERAAFVFAGDSPNDAPMFAHFPYAVGVANLLDFADRLTAWPAFVTEARSGAGFAELAEAVLAARAAH